MKGRVRRGLVWDMKDAFVREINPDGASFLLRAPYHGARKIKIALIVGEA